LNNFVFVIGGLGIVFGFAGFNPGFATAKSPLLGEVGAGNPFVIDIKSPLTLQIGTR